MICFAKKRMAPLETGPHQACSIVEPIDLATRRTTALAGLIDVARILRQRWALQLKESSMNANRGRHALIVFLVAMWPTLLGARCNPPPPPACDPSLVCELPRLSECLGQCNDPVTTQCSVNPCDGRVCDFGYRCLSAFPGTACQLATGLDIFFCDVPGPACATGLYCRTFGADFPPPNQAVHPDGTPYEGQCVAPAAETAECDSTWAPRSAGIVCEAGFACLPDPRNPGANACLRGCDAPGECPCNLGQCLRPPSIPPESVPSGAMGICGLCAGNGAMCSDGWGCCNPSAVCGVDGCCVEDDGPCGQGAGCCGTAICTGGSCHGCTDPGAEVDPAGPGCCHGTPDPTDPLDLCPASCLLLRSGAPPLTVYDGDACGGSGPCAGAYECKGGTATCRPTAPTPPETFNCVDDDCDGGVDEDADASCLGTPVGDGYDCTDVGPVGGEFAGIYRCDGPGGALRCDLDDAGWCAYDSLGNPIDNSGGSGFCHVQGDEDCGGLDGYCSAGQWCCSYVPGPFPMDPGHPSCSRAGFIHFPEGEDVPVGRRGPSCWAAGERSTVTSCPFPRDSVCFTADDDPQRLCNNCIGHSECGWCSAYGRCLPGDAMGADNEVDCGDGGWLRRISPAGMCIP